MKIIVPPGMTEEEVLKTIMLACDRVKNKYKCRYHDGDDVYQVAFIKCVEAMERYNGKHPLENFLMVNLHNRMHNFRRDENKAELKTVNFAIDEEPMYTLKPDRLKHFEQMIDEHLSVDIRHDYLRLRDGVKIPRVRQKKLYEELRRLASEFGDAEE